MRDTRTAFAVFVVGVALLVLGPAGNAAAQSPGSVALVIGNSRYPDSDAPLTTPAEDAKALAAELQKRGFTVELGENLTKRSLQEAGEKLLARIRPGASVVVAFSGYAIQSGRQNFLVPVDGQIWTEADVQRDGLSLLRLIAEIDRRGAAATTIVLDGAHRNPFERRFRSYSTGLAPLAGLPSNTSILYSAAPGAVLKESTAARSLFGTELVKQIAAAGAMAPAVLEKTRSVVSDSSSGAQVPWLFSSMRTDAPQARVGTPPASDSAGIDAAATMGDDFRAAQRTGTRQAYETFLAKHRSGPFADLARLELARLETSPSARPAEPPRQEARPADPPARPPESKPPESKPPEVKQADARAPDLKPEPSRTEPPRAEPPKAPPVQQQAELKQPELKPTAPPPSAILPYSADDQKLRADLSAAIEKNPSDVVSIYTRGQLFAVHNDFAPALADFDRVVKLQPQDVEALNNRCWVRAILNEFDGALADCNSALKIRPGFLDALDSRGFVNLKIGLPRRALADYEAALKVNAKHVSALYGRGIARLRVGQTAEGRNDMTNALALDPRVGEDFARYGVQ